MVIDPHWHVLCPRAAQKAGQLDPVKAGDYAGGVKDLTARINREKGAAWNRKMSDPQEQVADLDAAGIDLAILQPPPTGYYYWTEPALGAELARMINEHTAGFVRQHPDRFLGWATVPMQDAQRAAAEARFAIQELGMVGIAMTSNINGHGLDEERFQPLLAAAAELDAPIFIHPGSPLGAERLRNYYLTNFIGFPTETTLSAALLVFGGVFDRHPGLKVCLAHAGGVLPFLLGRLEHGQAQRPEAQERCQHPFGHYLKNIYVDTVVFKPETLRFVLSAMPPGHVVFGTDYPFDMADMDGVATVKAAVADPEAREQVLCRNMAALLGRVLKNRPELRKKIKPASK